MGREIRRVPKDWKHPKGDSGSYQAMYDKTFAQALEEFDKEKLAWNTGGHAKCVEEYGKELDQPYEDGHYDPNDYKQLYRPDWDESEMTHYQMYETVSEGTPVSPVFETLQELEDYLVENGDFWDQRRFKNPFFGPPVEPKWSREAAKNFCENKWVMTGMAVDGKVLKSKEITGNE